MSLICQREVLNLDDFQFSYFDMDFRCIIYLQKIIPWKEIQYAKEKGNESKNTNNIKIGQRILNSENDLIFSVLF